MPLFLPALQQPSQASHPKEATCVKMELSCFFWLLLPSPFPSFYMQLGHI